MLDPKQRLFEDRLITRDETHSLHTKSLAFLTDSVELQRLCIIVDDRCVLAKRMFVVGVVKLTVVCQRADVWSWSAALVKVRPFKFWESAKHEPEKEEEEGDSYWADSATGGCPADSSPRVPLLSDDDCELYSLAQRLKRMHKTFFRELRSDTATGTEPLCAALVVSVVRSRVLQGTHCGFLDWEDPDSELWYWCRAFGAECSAEVSRHTTHVISNAVSILQQ